MANYNGFPYRSIKKTKQKKNNIIIIIWPKYISNICGLLIFKPSKAFTMYITKYTL